MPDHTYITREKSAPGFMAFKDRFTLLLGANLMGDRKLKPVIVYHAENPHALKGYAKTSLPVPGARVEGVLHISGPPLLYPDGPG